MLGTNRVWSSFCLEWPTVRSRTPLLLHEDLAKPESIVHNRPMISHSQCCVTGHYFCSYFWSIFNLTSPHIPYLNLSPYAYSPFYAFHAHEQMTRTHLIGTTSHWTTCLLGYQHPKTVLLWFLFNPILCWSLLHCHQTLPPLKVLDFLYTEHK